MERSFWTITKLHKILPTRYPFWFFSFTQSQLLKKNVWQTFIKSRGLQKAIMAANGQLIHIYSEKNTQYTIICCARHHIAFYIKRTSNSNIEHTFRTTTVCMCVCASVLKIIGSSFAMTARAQFIHSTNGLKQSRFPSMHLEIAIVCIWKMLRILFLGYRQPQMNESLWFSLPIIFCFLFEYSNVHYCSKMLYATLTHRRMSSKFRCCPIDYRNWWMRLVPGVSGAFNAFKFVYTWSIPFLHFNTIFGYEIYFDLPLCQFPLQNSSNKMRFVSKICWLVMKLWSHSIKKKTFFLVRTTTHLEPSVLNIYFGGRSPAHSKILMLYAKTTSTFARRFQLYPFQQTHRYKSVQ